MMHAAVSASHSVSIAIGESITDARRRWEWSAPAGSTGPMFLDILPATRRSDAPEVNRASDEATSSDDYVDREVTVRPYIGPDPFDMDNPRMRQALGEINRPLRQACGAAL